MGEADPAGSSLATGVGAGAPVIKLKTVQVLDYPDSTDIVRQVRANQGVPIRLGQWGERLSVGVARDLVATISRRLPGVTIETRGGYGPSSRLLVSIERFEVTPDGRCTLTARWRLTTAEGKVLSPSEGDAWVETASDGTDSSAASAMTVALDGLAGEIAVTVNRALAATPGS